MRLRTVALCPRVLANAGSRYQRQHNHCIEPLRRHVLAPEAPLLCREATSETAAVLHYTFTRFSDLKARRDRCDCAPTEADAQRCFILPFDRMVRHSLSTPLLNPACICLHSLANVFTSRVRTWVWILTLLTTPPALENLCIFSLGSSCHVRAMTRPYAFEVFSLQILHH